MIKAHPRFQKYGANRNGEIFYLKRMRKLKPRKQKRGYLEVKVCDNDGQPRTYLAHRLVAECFHGPLLPSQTVDHLDFNKQNNEIENLDVVPSIENHARAAHRMPRGFNHYRNKFSPQDIDTIKSMHLAGISQEKIGRKFNCHQSVISRALRRKYG